SITNNPDELSDERILAFDLMMTSENHTSRLSLYDLKFKIASSAIESEIEFLFESILSVESQLTVNDIILVELRKFLNLKEFIDTHCQIRQYSFQIKKCNNIEYAICLSVELPIEVFNELHFLPDPEPFIANPDHYKDFLSVYSTQTSEKFCLSKVG
ncbi:15052_t:CDS:2, partial [Funneliformis mosseae]